MSHDTQFQKAFDCPAANSNMGFQLMPELCPIRKNNKGKKKKIQAQHEK